MSMKCARCGHDYNEILAKECPFCGQSSVETQKPTNKSCNSGCKKQCNSGQKTLAPAQTIQISSESALKANLKTICPKCHHENYRSQTHCNVCYAPLPTFTAQQEQYAKVRRIIQAMDPETREYYFRVFVRLILADQFDLLNEMTCDSQHGNGCQQVLTPLDIDCPACDAPHFRYECAYCSESLTPEDMTCPSCQNETYLSQLLAAIQGDLQDNGDNEIITSFEKLFGMKLRKYTYSSMMEYMEILASKLEIEQMARMGAAFADTLSQYLLDFSEQSKSYQLGSAMDMIRGSASFNGVDLSNISTPQPSASLQQTIKNARVPAINSPQSPQTTMPPQPQQQTPNVDADADAGTDGNDDENDVWNAVNL